VVETGLTEFVFGCLVQTLAELSDSVRQHANLLK
jgi:hypothetical protein